MDQIPVAAGIHKNHGPSKNSEDHRYCYCSLIRFDSFLMLHPKIGKIIDSATAP